MGGGALGAILASLHRGLLALDDDSEEDKDISELLSYPNTHRAFLPPHYDDGDNVMSLGRKTTSMWTIRGEWKVGGGGGRRSR